MWVSSSKNHTFLSVSAVTGLARAEATDLGRTEFQFMLTGERTEGRRKGKSERLSTWLWKQAEALQV